jgi:hypothetical protein
MLTKDVNIKIRELEAYLTTEQERYVGSIKLHDNSATIKNIRYDILARRFELEALYAQLK